MALLPVVDRDADPIFSAADPGGDTFPNNGNTEIVVYNASASAIQVTFPSERKCSQGFIDDDVQTAVAGGLVTFGPFRASRFNNPQGIAAVNYSSAAGVSVYAKRLR